MKIVSVLLWLSAAVACLGAEKPVVGTNDFQIWLTNGFRPWLTRSYPEIYSSFYPEWFHDHPAGLQPGAFTNWLNDLFPDLETEMFPAWLENPSPEKLGTSLPP